jgi:hypothetical protein
MHPRLDLPDGTYTLMPDGGDEGANGDVHYVVVEQDLDQSPEGPKANLTNEGKPRFIINPYCLFKYLQLSLFMNVLLRSGVDMKP